MTQTTVVGTGVERIPSRPSVLIADDEAEIRELIRRVLTPLDCDVWEADNGREVLRMVDQQRVDVVILDLVMPEMEGIETLQVLRNRRPQSKVLVISGAFDGSFLDCATMLGARAALKKPFSPKALVAQVRDLLES
jgi:CheY-like chemotaxis protein